MTKKDILNTANKAIYTAVILVLVFALAVKLNFLMLGQEPLGAPIIRGEAGEERVKEFRAVVKSDTTVNRVGLNGIFRYAPDGIITSCTLESEGEILGLDAQRLLKKSKSKYLLDLRNSGADTGTLIKADSAWSAIETEAKNAWRFKKFLESLNSGQYKGSPEATCIKTGLESIIANVERAHGDVFKEEILLVEEEKPALRITNAPFFKFFTSLFS